MKPDGTCGGFPFVLHLDLGLQMILEAFDGLSEIWIDLLGRGFGGWSKELLHPTFCGANGEVLRDDGLS